MFRTANLVNRTGPAACLAASLVFVLPAHAEMQFSAYGGMNENLSSRVRVDKAPVSETRTMDWEGNSFEMPPYWGVRATYWLNSNPSWGVALDYTHAKAYADLNFATDPTYSHLEFTDGLNILTVNLLYRFSPMFNGAFVPYAGFGVGVAIPHVEATLKGVPGRTYEYQLTGAAAQALAGIEYRLGESWSLFAEAKLSYAQINAELSGGGSLATELWSPQIAVGITYRFGGN